MTAPSDPLTDELLRMLAEITRRDVAGIAPDDDLGERLGIDSLTGLRFLATVEKRFDVRFPDQYLEDFRSLAAVRNFIERRRDSSEIPS